MCYTIVWQVGPIPSLTFYKIMLRFILEREKESSSICALNARQKT